MSKNFILIQGARQNNLKGLNLKLPLNELIVITGVSGSGKSSLAFDTIYSEGQRRYVETFSPYARQFLDRMDKPRADRIEGIPPAIAIDQTNQVRTSRSTVGTMTELNDHIKLLFARAARLFCRGCGKPVQRDSVDGIFEQLLLPLKATEPEILITFPVDIPENFTQAEVKELLAKQGYRRFHSQSEKRLEVVQDRVRLSRKKRGRIVEDLEAALKHGRGRVMIRRTGEPGNDSSPQRFSSDLHCPDCDIHYRDPLPSAFSFNSPIGACDACRGFGRVIGIDYNLVVPDETKTLAQGAVKPWKTGKSQECQRDLMRFARKRGIPTAIPWNHMTDAHKEWVLVGEGAEEEEKWYGVKGFFDWLESKSYKMHIRVLLSKYRAYRMCPACRGARLKPESLYWRMGNGDGLTFHDIMLLPLHRAHKFFRDLKLPPPWDEATEMVVREIRSRMAYLVEVGLGYLTLDRQSRTLSGGEVQRINLTTALGTSLVNALFVLDEPSIGLHSRDIRRLIGVLHRLRDAGNTLIVVEHDPEVIRAADRVLDLGPGPGLQGGEAVFFGKVPGLLRSKASLTGQYLTGAKSVSAEKVRRPGVSLSDSPRLKILGASHHNLKNIDVSIPLHGLVCFTGVSGSGKSTLVQDVCYMALRKLLSKPVEEPGKHCAIQGHEGIHEVVLVDQSPIGKTSRSTPASYVGALDFIRKLFSGEPLSMTRGYSPGMFSFNLGDGRCPGCGGNGFQHIEMQFLSDVYLRCPDCDGKRFRPEILEVKVFGEKSIADVLELTIAEAAQFFSEYPKVLRVLEPLRDVGLDYMKMGQPVPTLSGGEAQRLKLAGHLAKKTGGKNGDSHTLFLFDEPTTGLHCDDIATLLRALRQLVEQGDSVVVIEHNLDVIRAADWIIDLGPEGGEAGGEVLVSGPPEEVARCDKSYTGRALRQDYKAVHPLPCSEVRESPAGIKGLSGGGIINREKTPFKNAIHIHNARENNLREIDVTIPRDKFTVITGISGSGKSTVAHDILFAEGQRRYLESMNAYARQFVQPASRPDVDALSGLPPTVAIEQRTSRGGRKSTVATVTEIYHFLRLLFVKLGTQFCHHCHIPICPQTREAILAKILADYSQSPVRILAPLVKGRKGYYTDLAKWAAGKGFPHLQVDGELLPTDNWPRLDRFKEHDIALPVGELMVSSEKEREIGPLLKRALTHGQGVVYVDPLPHKKRRSQKKGPKRSRAVFSIARACPDCARSFEELDPRLFSFNSKYGWCPDCFGSGLLMEGFDEEQTGEETLWNDRWEGPERPCAGCGGKRLRPEALAVKFQDRSIVDFTGLTVEAAEKHFRDIKLKGREREIARDIAAELSSRLSFLKEVGLPYLSLDRAVPTLSGGEAQRIRLASQLGSNLRGVSYILDEPTIGLHARDNAMLLKTLDQLKSKGNTVIVVEHDEETIRHADHVVDLGPGAGTEGGRVVAQGTVKALLKNKESLTGRFLREPLKHPLAPSRGSEHTSGNTGNKQPALGIVGARLHNLKDVDIRIPLNRLVCVTGVSGSGKSTLVREVLHENLRRCMEEKRCGKKGRVADRWHGCEKMTGADSVRRVLEVDQTPIGKTPRSCPATYVGFMDDIRRIWSGTVAARMRGYGPTRFSFNVKGGRCPECEGQGVKKIEMSFLPNVSVLCEACKGQRFNPETLEIRFKEKNIAEVLAMSMEEAAQFFTAHRSIHRPLQLLSDVGLGYLTLGQQSPTLSGGEAQRIKLVTELAKARTEAPPRFSTAPSKNFPLKTSSQKNFPLKKGDQGGCLSERRPSKPLASTLYILDEPTIGLHMADVEKLIHVLHRLVDSGNTVVIIEHNLDIIAEADWIIDLGPEGGDKGGRIVAQGPPGEVVCVKKGSHTARFLADFVKKA